MTSTALGQNIAYIRVSSTGQNTDRQLDGLAFDKTFTEHASAKDAKRPILSEAMEYLRSGDTLHVHSIDRLARNLQDLLGILSGLTERGVTVKFHKEALTFTGEANPFQQLQLQIIGAVAEFERALIRERQREGIQKAKEEGKYKRPKVKALAPDQIESIRQRKEAGESVASLAREYRVSRQTLYVSLKREEASWG